MICENNYCIYWDNDTCISDDEVWLDFQGRCRGVTYVLIEEAELTRLRQEALMRLEGGK